MGNALQLEDTRVLNPEGFRRVYGFDPTPLSLEAILAATAHDADRLQRDNVNLEATRITKPPAPAQSLITKVTKKGGNANAINLRNILHNPQAIYMGTVEEGKVGSLTTGILSFIGYQKSPGGKLFEYQIGEDYYYSSMPPNGYAIFSGENVYYTVLRWKRTDDKFVPCNIVCFPLSQQKKLEELGLLPHD